MQQDQEDQHEGPQEPEDGEGDVHVEYAIGEYVAAKYNGDMHVGRVANIDDGEYAINCMESDLVFIIDGPHNGIFCGFIPYMFCVS